MFELRLILLWMLFFASTGCDDEPLTSIDRIPTLPVSGSVSVDGVPAAFLQVECHPDENALIRYPVTTMTDESGTFHFSTYETNDGLPEGGYKLTFRWVQPGVSEVDRLRGAYKDASKSKIGFEVKFGGSSEIGKIDLKTMAK